MVNVVEIWIYHTWMVWVMISCSVLCFKDWQQGPDFTDSKRWSRFYGLQMHWTENFHRNGAHHPSMFDYEPWISSWMKGDVKLRAPQNNKHEINDCFLQETHGCWSEFVHPTVVTHIHIIKHHWRTSPSVSEFKKDRFRWRWHKDTCNLYQFVIICSLFCIVYLCSMYFYTLFHVIWASLVSNKYQKDHRTWHLKYHVITVVTFMICNDII